MAKSEFSFINRVKILFSKKRLIALTDQHYNKGYNVCKSTLEQAYNAKVGRISNFLRRIKGGYPRNIIARPNAFQSEIELFRDIPYDTLIDGHHLKPDRYRLDERISVYFYETDLYGRIEELYSKCAETLAADLVENDLIKFEVFDNPSNPDERVLRGSIKLYKLY